MAARPPAAHGAFAIDLTVDIAAIEEGRAALIAYLEPFALDARVINRVEVVLEEIVSNVVRHSRGADRLTIEAECVDCAVRLTVEDNGLEFDPLHAPEPASFSALDDAPLGGQGIPLIKRLSQTVDYRRIGPRNRLSAMVAPQVRL